jgi:hypothetical protein
VFRDERALEGFFVGQPAKAAFEGVDEAIAKKKVAGGRGGRGAKACDAQPERNLAAEQTAKQGRKDHRGQDRMKEGDGVR